MNFFYQSEKKFEKKFFCLKSPETQSKSKKLKEFSFLKKLKFSPLILKNTCKIFMFQGLHKACLVQRFWAQALNLCQGLLVSSLCEWHWLTITYRFCQIFYSGSPFFHSSVSQMKWREIGKLCKVFYPMHIFAPLASHGNKKWRTHSHFGNELLVESKAFIGNVGEGSSINVFCFKHKAEC